LHSAIENQAHGARKAAPFARLFVQLLAAGGGERVEPRLAVVLAYAPLGADPFLVFEPLQGHIERAMVDEEHVLRLPLNRARHSLAVAGAKQKGFKNEQVQRALQQCDAVVVISLGSHSTQVSACLGSNVNPRAKNFCGGCLDRL
jgi:hypothetical protein